MLQSFVINANAIVYNLVAGLITKPRKYKLIKNQQEFPRRRRTSNYI